MTQPHEWKWDGRVTVMDGTTLIAVLGTDGGPSAIAERARIVEAAPRLLEALRNLLRHAERCDEILLNETGIGVFDETDVANARAVIAAAKQTTE